MERKLGEVFTYNGKTYQVIKGCGCIGCDFVNRCYNFLYKIHGSCSNIYRKDNISVVFKEVNNMEIKNNQLTIDIPEGMEIDLENSDLAKGIIKFKPKNLTYEYILHTYTIEYGSLVVSNRHIDKLLAVSKLMDIAKYYNKDWRPRWDNSGELKYYIYYSYEMGKYQIGVANRSDYGNIYFRCRDHIQSIIDNPNFRDILDAIYKD